MAEASEAKPQYSRHPEGFRSFIEHSEWRNPSKTRSHKPPSEGLPFIKRSMTRKAIMNPNRKVTMQCMQGEDKQFYYIHIDPYNELMFEIIDEVSPLLVNPTPSQFEPGAMYTYVIASIIEKDRDTGMDKWVSPMKLYAAKAMNMFEIGTKHHQIFYRMVKQLGELSTNQLQYALHAAGEIDCIDPTTLVFNFFSGTYKMKHKIRTEKREEIEFHNIRKLMHQIDPTYKIEFDLRPFIVKDIMQITQHEIERLRSRGIPVFGFSTNDRCRDMRSGIMRYKHNSERNPNKEDMTLDQMIAKYHEISALPPPKGHGGNKKTMKKRKSKTTRKKRAKK